MAGVVSHYWLIAVAVYLVVVIVFYELDRRHARATVARLSDELQTAKDATAKANSWAHETDLQLAAVTKERDELKLFPPVSIEALRVPGRLSSSVGTQTAGVIVTSEQIFRPLDD